MDCFHCLGKKSFPLSCRGIMHMDFLTGECLVCAGTGEQPPTVESPTTFRIDLDITNEIDALIKHVEELEKDSARLDFIQQNGLGGHGWDAHASNTRGFVISNTKNINGRRTVREAIDEEMKRRNKPTVT